jgi:hypothetical protein
MRLYEINEQLERLLDIGDGRMVDEETGELFDQEALEALEMEREEKIDGCLFFIKNCKADAKKIDEEIKHLQAKKQALENKAERTREYVAHCLQGEKFKSVFNSAYYAKTVKVEVDEAMVKFLPDEFIKTTIKVEPKKTELKKALMDGAVINGAVLVENLSLTVK